MIYLLCKSACFAFSYLLDLATGNLNTDFEMLAKSTGTVHAPPLLEPMAHSNATEAVAAEPVVPGKVLEFVQMRSVSEI